MHTIHAVMYQPIKVFPILFIKIWSQMVAMDYTELVFRPGLVRLLYIAQSEESFFLQVMRTVGYLLQTKYPCILEEIVSFVQLHGFAAHERRRTVTATCCGVRLEDVRQHLLKNLEGLDKISKTKVNYLMCTAANIHSHECERHKDTIACADKNKNRRSLWSSKVRRGLLVLMQASIEIVSKLQLVFDGTLRMCQKPIP